VSIPSFTQTLRVSGTYANQHIEDPPTTRYFDSFVAGRFLTTPRNKITMSYFKDIDTWLDEFLSAYPTDDDIRRMREEIKAKLLESYRNGQAAVLHTTDGRPAADERQRPRPTLDRERRSARIRPPQ
jgi:hypothetical protein